MDVQAFTVYDMIARGASVHGDAPAVIQDDRPLSFREFKDRADALAGGLAALGIGKGERVVERAAPRMIVVDASTLPVVTGWPEKKKAVPHWYQFGGSPAPGFKAFDALYGAPGRSGGADVSPDDPFA